MPALRSQWREFNFFDRQVVEEPPSIFTQNDVMGACLAKDLIYLGCSGGTIHIVDRTFQTHTFDTGLPTGRLTFLRAGGQGDTTLVTLTEDEEAAPLLQIWDLSKVPSSLPGSLGLSPPVGSGKATTTSGASSHTSTSISPILLRSIPVRTGERPYPVTSLALLGSLEQIALGFADGQVILVTGDIPRDRSLKQRCVHSSPEPITFLGYRGLLDPTLYITTVAKTLVCTSTTQGPGLLGKESIQVLDETGCGVDCAIVNPKTGYLVVGREEAIYYYTPEGRGPCFALEGPKSALFWCDSYLGLLSQVSGGGEHAQTALTLFDPEHKLVAHTSNSLPAPVPVRVYAWGGLFLLAGGKERFLYRFQEMETEAKLRLLSQQSLYVLAISLAKHAGYDAASVSAITRRYGDHLYGKADYDGAMAQYTRTIGYLEPSYVIRKFLDAQRIRHLTTYLQELHIRELATAEHTTLLINCYTKLGDTRRLERFIKAESEEIRFDVETAITVCRQAGYHDLALHLARRFGDHAT